MFQRALICTDLSDGLYRLTQAVASLHASGFSHITFFHNVPIDTGREIPRVDTEAIEQAHQRFNQWLTPTPAEVEIDIQVVSGRPIDTILKAIQSAKPDVIFLGTQVRTSLAETVFGSTTVELFQRAALPVVILRPQLMSTYRIDELNLRCQNLFNHLLIPYDGSKGAESLVSQIRHQAEQNPSSTQRQCVLCWIIDQGARPELTDQNQLEVAQAKLDQAKSDLMAAGIAVRTVLKEGEPLEELLAIAEQEDISAIAGCSNPPGGLMRWSVPSFTQALVRSSWHPVLHFPTAKP